MTTMASQPASSAVAFITPLSCVNRCPTCGSGFRVLVNRDLSNGTGTRSGGSRHHTFKKDQVILVSGRRHRRVPMPVSTSDVCGVARQCCIWTVLHNASEFSKYLNSILVSVLAW